MQAAHAFPLPDDTPPEDLFTTAGMDDLESILQLEYLAYPNPWSRRQFTEILRSQGTSCGHYLVQLLWSKTPPGGTLRGYYVAMLGYEEVHLLNLAVHPDCQKQGRGLVLLQHLRNWAQWYGARTLWLEVRASNPRAQRIYREFGFEQVAMRKDYYPLPQGGREDALVMQLPLA
ncbi:MAG: ribosomal protein S18-alanine N-acetyltransferase [Brachymonas sp.]|nr:ribosomal protein S18-alanine N-acetyltransferase [Brachymonas sp.]